MGFTFGIGDIIGAGVDLYNSNRHFKQQQKMHDQSRRDALDMFNITNERDDTAVQRRRRDLEAAGLHPTLAAGQGAMAHPGTPGHGQATPGHQMRQIRTLEMAQLRETIKHNRALRRKTDAETWQINNDIKLRNLQEGRANDLHLGVMELQGLEVTSRKLGITSKQLENAMLSLERDYMEKHKGKMPIALPIAQYQELLERAFGYISSTLRPRLSDHIARTIQDMHETSIRARNLPVAPNLDLRTREQRLYDDALEREIGPLRRKDRRGIPYGEPVY